MGEVFAFLGEILLRVVIEGVIEGLRYLGERLWSALIGRKRGQERRLQAMAAHERARRDRRIRAEEIRRKHGRLRKRRLP